jgi:hypothetical protein
LVPSGRLSVILPEVSVAAVNAPEPTCVATAVGVEPEIVKVTNVGAWPPPPPPVFPPLPPQPATTTRTEARSDKRGNAEDMTALSVSPRSLLRKTYAPMQLSGS